MAGSTLHIWMARQTAALEQARFDALAAGMPEMIRQELAAYKRWQDAQASLAGKLLLKHALQETGLPFSIQDIRQQHKDRPYIDPAFDFNISHSGEYVVLVLSKANKVGVDIERFRQLDIQLFRKYFSEPEWGDILNAEDPLPDFFRYWTIKEAAIKCDGRGVEVLGKTFTLDGKTVSCDSAVWNYSLVPVAENYSCAVCSQQAIGEIILKEAIVF